MSQLHNWENIDPLLMTALREDAGSGDVTTTAVIPGSGRAEAVIMAKEGMIVCGLPYSDRLFHLADPDIKFRSMKKEGASVRKGTILAEISGSTVSVLAAERSALNLLQRSCGIASMTAAYVRAVKGLSARITDTRKTPPGLRILDKYAVRTGGGHNHRFSLSDGILIKDNHIAAAGSIEKAVKRARLNAHHLLKIEVEVSDMPGVRQAIKSEADIIMLDNMGLSEMEKAVSVIKKAGRGILVEASGNISLENVRQTAETGVDIISVGALTHSPAASDISLRISS